jgi:pimeloyl-[acyl-carrier protein] methyl ester esterase
MHSKELGEGDPLILIHGWGMNAKIWDRVESGLSKNYALIIVNFPGMGGCKNINNYSMESLVDELDLLVPNNSSIVGWSLGGQLAIAYQKKYSKKVKKLILLSTTPCFINKSGWDYGIKEVIFDKFSKQLILNWRATIEQFLLLQLHGLPNMRKATKDLQNEMFKLGEPEPNALINSLELLKKNDLRHDLCKISVSTLIISGGRDRIVPVDASVYMYENVPGATLEIFENANHIPFLTETQRFVDTVQSFINS